jgi:hypothetical protein
VLSGIGNRRNIGTGIWSYTGIGYIKKKKIIMEKDYKCWLNSYLVFSTNVKFKKLPKIRISDLPVLIKKSSNTQTKILNL